MPVEWMKKKHRSHKPRGKFKANYTGNPGKKKVKRPLTQRERELIVVQPSKVMILGANGKKRTVNG